MIDLPSLTRRSWLFGAAGVTVAFAACSSRAKEAPTGRPKMVVIIARGAMDGLSVLVPYADANYRALRGDLALPNPNEEGGVLRLDGDFGLHPSLSQLHAMHRAGEVRFAPAAAIPVRVRSHFEAQDVLESGEGGSYEGGDGWLNRALAASGGERALAVGAQTPLILKGTAPVGGWSPGRESDVDRLATIVQDLYAHDALLGPALAAGIRSETQADVVTEGLVIRRNDYSSIGAAVARFMKLPEGPDFVALSLDGYDTHARQAGLLANRLKIQDGVLGGLKTGLGDDWRSTVVVVATEFGRTARINGTFGTDHGTASSLIVAGGALKPGGLIGDWPTLAENQLFEGRDLAPTIDVRSVFKGVLRDHMGVDRAALDAKVFPNSAEAPTTEGLV